MNSPLRALALFPLLVALAAAQPTTATAQTFVLEWGSLGTGDGQFDYPTGIAVDPDGNVYVADSHNYRIQKFSSTGVFLGKWGSPGIGPGQFTDFIRGLAIDPTGLYAVDTGRNRIQKFTLDGAYIGEWGSTGSGNGQFSGPWGIASSVAGDVYVADGNRRIQRFTRTGVYVGQWGSPGTGDGQFGTPHGVTVDAAGNVLVADGGGGTHRVQKFTFSGAYLGRWAVSLEPHDVTIGPGGDVFVVFPEASAVREYTAGGSLVTEWHGSGFVGGIFGLPLFIASDGANVLYVSDWGNHRIQKFAFAPTPAVPVTWGRLKGQYR